MSNLRHADRYAGADHTYQLTGHNYMLSGDQPVNTEQRRAVQEAMYQPKDTLEDVQNFYEKITTDLIMKKRRKLGDAYQIDIVQE